MNVTDEEIAYLRAFAVEPVRVPMSRKESWPSAQGRFIEMAQELSRVRGALRDAISIIEALRP